MKLAIGQPRIPMDDSTARLRDGYTLADIADAVRGCRASRWHMGENPGGVVHNDIALICRDGSHLEKFRDAYCGTAKVPRACGLCGEPLVGSSVEFAPHGCVHAACREREWAAHAQDST
mgnify:CR=1 FL=1